MRTIITITLATLLMILPAKAIVWNDWNFTPESDIPPFKQGDVVYKDERDFETFLELMRAAASAPHAYQLAERKFGKFPLRFRGGQFLIVTIRPYYIEASGCFFPAIRAEYLDLDVEAVANPYSSRDPRPAAYKPRRNGWINAFPRFGDQGGYVIKDVNILYEDDKCILRDGVPINFRKYCDEVNRPPSYPRYR